MCRFRSHRIGFALLAALFACVTSKRQVRPVDFTARIWQLRIDVDSAPTRNPAKGPTLGTVDLVAHRYSLDFWRAINRKLPNGAYLAPSEQPQQYKVILGDSTSFDEKIVMIGEAVTPDSIIGTWTETIVCCSAGGRFVLWR